MQANYPKKLPTIHWDTLNVEYPIEQFRQTGISSEAIARKWRGQPEVIKEKKHPNIEEVQYSRDYNVTKNLNVSLSALDHGYKQLERFRINKHTQWDKNEYIYPPSRKLSERVPASMAHQTTETKRAYDTPEVSCRLTTDKNQYKHPAFPPFPQPDEIRYHKKIEALDTTYEGYEKYLDPYLTTSRLHHRPYTAHELTKLSNCKDIATYYTYADVTWVRVPRPKTDEWKLSISRPKSMYDREKFKDDFREIRTHNKLRWVPGAFRTDIRDNYVQKLTQLESQIHNYEEEVKTQYQRTINQLAARMLEEDLTTLQSYTTENSIVGSKKPLCSLLDPYIEKNKRLMHK